MTTPSAHWPERLRQARVDFVFIDTEHIPLGRELLSWMCQAYSAVGIPPVVRIPSPDAYEAAKVLGPASRPSRPLPLPSASNYRRTARERSDDGSAAAGFPARARIG